MLNVPLDGERVTHSEGQARPAWLAIAVAVSMVVGACSPDDTPAIETAPVEAAEVVQTVAAPARIEPRERRRVTASVPGTVVRLRVEDGDEVSAGDTLVVLESDQVDAALSQADAAVEAAGALGGAPLTPDLSPIVAAVRAQLEGTLEPLISTLSAQARRIEDPAAREQALTAVAGLVSGYEETRSSLLRAERRARGSTAAASAAQRQSLEAQREQAEAALKAAQERQDALTVTAPIDGVIELGGAPALPGAGADSGGGGLDGLLGGADGATGPLSVGSVVTPGQTLFTVYDLDGFHAVATVDEIDVVLVEEGQRATVLVDAFPEAELSGRVEHVAVAPDRTATGGVVYPVRVTLSGQPADAALRVGLTASAEIVVRRVDSDHVVPSAALRRRDGREVVLVARDGVARVVPVEVAALGRETAAIKGDLGPDDRVVVVGADELDDGDPLP